MSEARALLLASRWVPRLPGALGRGLFEAAAWGSWAVRSGGARQLERNLARLRPNASRREIRRITRDALRSYLRYFWEAFQMPAWTPDQLEARVRLVGAEELRADIAAGRTAVGALAHTGNWDLAGAWANRFIAPVTTVVERLEPAAVFDAFVSLREGNGVTLIPFERAGGTFRALLRQAAKGGQLIPIIADRDLTQGGVEVRLAGHPARVAAGPAALALSVGARLYPIHVRYERISGARRRKAGTPWGTVLEFAPPVSVPDAATRQATVAALTQAWVDVVADRLVAHPESWHMLQKVFVADLDADRLKPAEGAVQE